LWKHHAAQPQADRINEVAAERGEAWLALYGGKLSAEWQLAKGLQLYEEDRVVYAAADRWIEAADWIVRQLTGTESRNRCTAGYKGVFQDGAYPSRDYLAALDPGFADFFDGKVAGPIVDLGSRVGGLTAEAAAWTGLRAGIAVAAGNVDAHVTSAACDALDDGQLLAIMGTSTCHVMNSKQLVAMPGMCGVVEGGIVAGRYGYEAGQSGVGDIFAWWIDNAVPDRYVTGSVHEQLSAEAARQPVGAHGLVALDWMNGNRSVLVDHELSGLIVGLTLSTTAVDVYRALLEATAFGTRRIMAEFEAAQLPVTELVVAGGLTKNALLLQIYADVTRKSLRVSSAEQAPALGSAIHAAVAAGVHPDVPTAAKAMSAPTSTVYEPDESRALTYDLLYDEYRKLHDYFGYGDDGNDVMHRLHRLKLAVRRR
jgi:L-ribulokinase